MAPPHIVQTPARAASKGKGSLSHHTVSSRRALDKSALALRRRRAAAKSTDPLELLAVVVGAVRAPHKFVCPICASTFGRRCELKRHVSEVHTLEGARRFACKYPACEKSFTRKDALAKHEMVKHQGKRRFVCPTCCEKFTSRYDLSRHNVRVHSNVKKRFTCEFCAAGFSQKSQLTMHKGRVHSDAKTPTPTPPTSRPRSPEHTERRTSMDSLAAVAVAMAKEEEKQAKRRKLARNTTDMQLCSRNGPPSPQRAAGDHRTSFANRSTLKEEAAAAALAADALLEAAAALQPITTESSFATMVTDDDQATTECMGTTDESQLDDSKIQSYPQTPSSIVQH